MATVSITIYQIMESTITLAEIQKKIKNCTKTKKQIDPEGNEIELKTTIESIKKLEHGVSAIVKYDYLDEFFDRNGNMKSVVKSKPVNFMFTHGSGVYLLVFANKSDADKITGEISQIAFPRYKDFILGCRINPDDMEKFIKEHDPIIMQTGWREVRIPTISGATITGKDIDNSSDFKRYDLHGTKYNMRVHIKSMGFTISLNRHATLHFFSKVEENKQIFFIRKHILRLCK